MGLLLVGCLEQVWGRHVSFALAAQPKVVLMVLDRLPRQLFVRSMMTGITLGGLSSAIQIAQDMIGRRRDEEIRRVKAEERRLAGDSASQSGQSVLGEEVGRRKGWEGLKAWISGLLRGQEG